jgi:hypothetical protein
MVEKDLCLPGKGKLHLLQNIMTLVNSVRMYTHKGHDMGVMQLHFGRNLVRTCVQEDKTKKV